MMMRKGRAPIYCAVCTASVATISEAKVQQAATFTPWRGRTTAILLKMVTENAAVVCLSCEQLAHKAETGKDAATP